MTGARIIIELDAGATSAALSGLSQQLDAAGQQQLLDKVGEYVLIATRDRAMLQVAPDGAPWSPLSPRYARRKDKLRPGLPLLKFDNHMLGDQLVWQVEGDSVLIGTNAPYGARQQFGGGGIPARPWLGLSDLDEEQIAQRMIAFLQKSLDGNAP
ncbi:MAG: phage virion morphogenesis protein [Rhodanobacter sp.]